jgi:hypothetical protein
LGFEDCKEISSFALKSLRLNHQQSFKLFPKILCLLIIALPLPRPLRSKREVACHGGLRQAEVYQHLDGYDSEGNHKPTQLSLANTADGPLH